MLETGPHLVVFVLDLSAERFRMIEKLLTQIANLFRHLAVEIADPFVEMPRGLREVAGDLLQHLRPLVLLTGEAIA